MKRSASRATILAYLGIVLLIVGLYPALNSTMDASRLIHALWHVWLFVGAAFLVYGVETLRRLARRHRRLTT